MKLEHSQQIFKKKTTHTHTHTLKYQTSWKSVQWEPSCSVQMDTRDEANSRVSQFYKCT